ncbi:CbtA family protein [Jidongwangia harbinensis]|uniref:CbtA family protein n=1 Tax=Jidongwangia harbinensis TaxID=2878561 RepID=UPI001CD97879|nr:CbtA family protein [Jidongwangia harbinensis]MCA2214984.1 CbtA family protein [Jidongwangia harbinensis]
MPLTGHPAAPRYRALLLRGLLAGLIAGLLAGVFAYATGEPHIDAAIAIEEQAAGTHDHGGDAAVSRSTQRAGLLLATTLYGIAMGGLLATGYTLLRRRLRTTHDTRAALSLAGAALLGAVLVPYLKYPPNPPAVGDPATINQRTISWLTILVIGLVAVWAAVVAARSVPTEWARAAAGTGAFLAVVTAGYLLLPAAEPAPDGFPADLLWDFRLASLGTQAVLWTTLGLAYAGLLHRRAAEREAAPAHP